MPLKYNIYTFLLHILLYLANAARFRDLEYILAITQSTNVATDIRFFNLKQSNASKKQLSYMGLLNLLIFKWSHIIIKNFLLKIQASYLIESISFSSSTTNFSVWSLIAIFCQVATFFKCYVFLFQIMLNIVAVLRFYFRVRFLFIYTNRNTYI